MSLTQSVLSEALRHYCRFCEDAWKATGNRVWLDRWEEAKRLLEREREELG